MFKRVIFTIVGIILVIWIMSFFGWRNIISTLLSMNIYLFLVALVFEIIVLSLFSLRFQMVCQRFKKIGFVEAFKIVIMGLTTNFLTPLMKVGGEPAKIYLLKKKGRSTERSSAMVMIDSTTELITIYTIVLVGVISIFFTGTFGHSFLLVLGIGLSIIFALITGLFSILINEKWLRKIINFGIGVAKKFKEDIKTRTAKSYAKKFNKAFHSLLRNKFQMTKLFGVSIGAKLIEFLRIWIIFLAFGKLVPFTIILFAWSIIMLLGMIPGLPGNLGVMEAGGTSVFVLLGLASGLSASVILIDRFLTFWFILMIGLPVAGTLKLKKTNNIFRR